MLAALEDASGSFVKAIEICETLLRAQGHVYPSTLDHVTLCAETRDGQVLDGQAVACRAATALQRGALRNEAGASHISANKAAIRAILDADLVVLGPGSLFTSIIPNILVPGILEAVRQSEAACLFVCSLADAQGETWGLSAREHYQALVDHGMGGLIDFMLVHTPVPLRAESPGMDSFIAASCARCASTTRTCRPSSPRARSCWRETSPTPSIPPGIPRRRCARRSCRS